MKDVFEWVHWFDELNRKIASSERSYLVERVKKIPWKSDTDTSNAILNYGDEYIDPFSFIYTLASKASSEASIRRIYTAVGDLFDLDSSTPSSNLLDTMIFPTPPSIAKLLFHDGGSSVNPDLMWELHRKAVLDPESITEDEIKRALSIKQVGVKKLTQSLFLANPRAFLPYDKHSNSSRLNLFGGNGSQGEFSWTTYLEGLSKIKDVFAGCELYEVNIVVYLYSANQIENNNPQYFQVSTNVFNENEDHWEEFVENNFVYVGGNGDNNDRYPIVDPKRGDVILVRYGRFQAKGIAIVTNNEYDDVEFDPRARIHVLWVDKLGTVFEDQMAIAGFSRAKKIRKLFREAPVYRQTFEVLDKLHGQTDSNGDVNDDAERSTIEPRFPKNQILFGPPGTGKTWEAERRALSIVEGREVSSDVKEFRGSYSINLVDLEHGTGRIGFITFHQNYSYEDFVEGIRPILGESNELSYELRPGLFKSMSELAKSRPNEPFVLIIDEINRGNIAKIFGELITLIESSRREGESHQTFANLTYSGEKFAAPKNLYVIGTMNTADRSIQLLDTALRRRFTFIELMPDCDHPLISEDIEGVDCRRLLGEINRRIAFLLDREHQIGHTYFINVTTIEQLATTFRDRILPLLQEYFFDDWEKIRIVLNNNGFVRQTDAPEVNAESRGIDPETRLYVRVPDDSEMWTDPSKYKSIYLSQSSEDHGQE